MADAEGTFAGDICPECGSLETVTYHYREGYCELECLHCGFNSEPDDVSDFVRDSGALCERERPDRRAMTVPVKRLKA